MFKVAINILTQIVTWYANYCVVYFAVCRFNCIFR